MVRLQPGREHTSWVMWTEWGLQGKEKKRRQEMEQTERMRRDEQEEEGGGSMQVQCHTTPQLGDRHLVPSQPRIS